MIDIDRNYAEKVLQFLPPGLRPGAVIAGGWPVSPTLASDIDVWVLAGGEQNFHKCRLQMYRRLSEMGLTEYIADDSNLDHYGTQHHLVATIPGGYAGKTIQLLLSDLRTPQQLVDSFDISTHAVAIGFPEVGKSSVYFGGAWTSVKEPPKVLRFTTPEQTLERLFKISQRYGLTPDTADVERLQSKQEEGWVAA